MGQHLQGAEMAEMELMAMDKLAASLEEEEEEVRRIMVLELEVQGVQAK